MKFGLLLILIGLFFLLNNLGYLPLVQWGIVWPVALIVMGLYIIMKRRSGSCYWCNSKIEKDFIN